MLRIPHCLENRLPDGGDVASLRRLPSEADPQGLERPEGLNNFTNFSYLFGPRQSDLSARNIVPQPLRYGIASSSSSSLYRIQELSREYFSSRRHDFRKNVREKSIFFLQLLASGSNVHPRAPTS
jgi:hypothetical protein